MKKLHRDLDEQQQNSGKKTTTIGDGPRQPSLQQVGHDHEEEREEQTGLEITISLPLQACYSAFR